MTTRARTRTGAAVGSWATTALADVSVDVAILGTNGFSVRRGMTTPDQAEAVAKRAMVAAGRRCVVLADSSKAELVHFHRFAELDDVALRWGGADDYDLRASLRGGEADAAGFAPGIDHLDVDAVGDAQSTLLQLPT